MAGVGTMDNNTKFKVGDRAKAYRKYPCTIVAIDSNEAWVRFDDNTSGVMYLHDLEPVVAFPERWINVYGNGYASGGYTSRGYSDEASADWESIHGRIGVIHLHSDGTLTMEAP